MNNKPAIHLNVSDEEQVRVFNWAMNLAAQAEVSNEFLAKFWNNLILHNDIYEEFVYFMNHRNFLCKANVEGYTVADIMIYQVDHFKSAFDMPNMDKYKHNGDYMVMMAFNTLIEMKSNPTPYIYNMKHNSGTDFPDKFFNLTSLGKQT